MPASPAARPTPDPETPEVERSADAETTSAEIDGETDGATAVDDGATASTRRPWWRAIRPYYAIITLLYLLLSLLGITTSSLSVPFLQEHPPVEEGTLAFMPEIIRSDEYLTYTPITLSFIANGSIDGLSPLAQDPGIINQLPSDGFFESVVFFDGTVLRLGPVLPDEMLFAGWWWLPTYLLAMALPPLLQRLGCRRSLSYLAVALVAFAPATAWWSMIPTRVLAFPTVAALLTVLGAEQLRRGRKLAGFAMCIIAGPLLARGATNYVPWALTISIPLVLATAVWMLRGPKSERKSAWIAMGVTTASTVLFFGMLLYENMAAIKSELATVYPGLREVQSLFRPMALSFGAPDLYSLHTYYPTDSNQSEMSSAFGLMLIVAFVVLLSERGWRKHRSSFSIVLLTAISAIWLSWTLATIRWTSALPIFNRVPPGRAAESFGYIAGFAALLALSRMERTSSRTYWLAGALVGSATAFAGLDAVHSFSAPLRFREIVMVSVITAVVIGWLVARPSSRIAAAAVALAALATTFQANPIQRGLGDLRDSELAQYLTASAESSKERGELWLSDSSHLDAVLTATGVPVLSGHQVTGPIADEWKKLDPTGAAESAWNRGASFVTFDLSGDGTPKVELRDDAVDKVTVAVSPCALPKLGLNVRYVVSMAELTQPCLDELKSFPWQGNQAHVYHVVT